MLRDRSNVLQSYHGCNAARYVQYKGYCRDVIRNQTKHTLSSFPLSFRLWQTSVVSATRVRVRCFGASLRHKGACAMCMC